MSKVTRLISSMFRVGLIGFGGGNALIPILEQIAVDEQKLVSQEEYDEDVVVASITPGALPVEIAGGIGRRSIGSAGLLVGSISLALPGVILTLVLSAVISVLSSSVLLQIRYLAVGITAFICYLLTQYLLGTVKQYQCGELPWQVFPVAVAVFLLTCGKNLYRILGISRTPLFALATIHIFIVAFFLLLFLGERPAATRWIVGCAVSALYLLTKAKLGFTFPGTDQGIALVMVLLAIYGVWSNRTIVRHLDRDSVCRTGKEVGWILLFTLLALIPSALITQRSLPYGWNGFLSSLLSFGGGDAYLTVADGLFVQTGLIEESDFYNYLVPIVNIIPGSILCKTLSGIGYFLGYAVNGSIIEGIAVALSGFLVSLLASCGIFDIIGCLYGNFRELYFIRGIRRWIRPIVSGLMLTVILSLVFQNVKLGQECMAGGFPVVLMLTLYGADLFMHYALKMKNGNIVFLSALFSFAVCNLMIG